MERRVSIELLRKKQLSKKKNQKRNFILTKEGLNKMIEDLDERVYKY